MKRRLALRSGLAVAAATTLTAATAPAAFAAADWCDADPLQLVITSGGKIVPIFVTNGARSALRIAQLLLAEIKHTTKSVDGGRATLVTVSVVVPNGLLGASFDTRCIVSSGPLGTFEVYATTTGTSGRTMTTQFKLPAG